MTFEFRRPLGAVLCGGGSLGSWQAGVIEGLVRQEIHFDKITGFSAGAINASHYFLGWNSTCTARWRDIDQNKTLQWSPKLRPLSLFSDGPLRDTFRELSDEQEVKHKGRCEIEVVTLRLDDLRHSYFRFGPGGKPDWHGPIVEKLVASCAIPLIFPAVELIENGRRSTHIDGGVPGRDRMHAHSLAGCKDVIVIELVRPEEVGRFALMPWTRRDYAARAVSRRHMNDAVASLQGLKDPPRIFRLVPSQILDFMMLSFRSAYCSPAVELGLADAERLLNNPQAALAQAPCL